MKNYQTVSIQFTKSDADKLTEKAKQNRLKLSSYLRQLLTKDLIEIWDWYKSISFIKQFKNYEKNIYTFSLNYII